MITCGNGPASGFLNYHSGVHPASGPPFPSRFADSVVRSLLSMNASAFTLLLAALLVAGIWQDAAMDFVPYIAVGFALHGIGLVAAVAIQALRYLRSRARSAGIARALGYVGALAFAASIACFAAGAGTVAWGALNVLVGDTSDDSGSRSLPL